MQLARKVIIFASFWCAGFAQADVPKQKIILSYFEGFAGSESNPSESIANLVKANFASDPNVELILCSGNHNRGLKVAFFSQRDDLVFDQGRTGPLQGGDTAFEQLTHCYERNPDAKQIISLAEGDCKLYVTGAALNLMGTDKNKVLSDNNGNYIPKLQKIDVSTPDVLFTGDLNILATCSMKQRTAFKFLDNIGAYVCNNLTYNFEKKIQTEHLPVTYSMIHVPLGFKAFKNKCDQDQKEYKQILQARGEKLTEETMSALLAEQVTSFIRAQNELLLTYPEIQADPAKASRDMIFKPIPLNTPEMHQCVNSTAALQAGAKNAFNSLTAPKRR